MMNLTHPDDRATKVMVPNAFWFTCMEEHMQRWRAWAAAENGWVSEWVSEWVLLQAPRWGWGESMVNFKKVLNLLTHSLRVSISYSYTRHTKTWNCHCYDFILTCRFLYMHMLSLVNRNNTLRTTRALIRHQWNLGEIR